jgi:hypothetical protein
MLLKRLIKKVIKKSRHNLINNLLSATCVGFVSHLQAKCTIVVRTIYYNAVFFFVLRKFCSWGGVWGINFCKFWDYIVSKKYLFEIYVVIAIILFPVQVLVLMDVCWNGVYNFKVRHCNI